MVVVVAFVVVVAQQKVPKVLVGGLSSVVSLRASVFSAEVLFILDLPVISPEIVTPFAS